MRAGHAYYSKPEEADKAEVYRATLLGRASFHPALQVNKRQQEEGASNNKEKLKKSVQKNCLFVNERIGETTSANK